MSRIVMKEAPDVDYYVEWTSIAEGWTFAGTRADMLTHLSDDADPWLSPEAPHHPEQRLRRADETGTTSQWVAKAGMRDRYPEAGAWDSRGEIYQQIGFCPRPNIFVLARRQIADPQAEVRDLLRPFDDGCRCGHEHGSHHETGCGHCDCLMRVDRR